MGKLFFDFNDDDFAMPVSDNMAIDSKGNLNVRMSDNMAMGMKTGEVHLISGWNKKDE